MAQHDDLWVSAADAAGYATHDGKALIGVSGTEGDGFIVGVPAPTWFASVRDEGMRRNLAQALLAHALRVGQSKVKAEEKPTRETAATGAASAIDGTYKPSKSRDNNIVDSETALRFANHVKALVLAKMPNATTEQIDATVAKQAETEGGKALIAKMRGEVLESGTYTVSRKGGGKAQAIEVTIGGE